MKTLLKTFTFSLLLGLFAENATCQNPITGPAGGCPGGTFTYQVLPNNGVLEYFWKISGNGKINGTPGQLALDSSGHSVQVTLPSTGGPATLQLQVFFSPSVIFMTTKALTVQMGPATQLPSVTTCFGEPIAWCGDTLAPGPGSLQLECFYPSAAGCDSIVKCTFISKPPLITNLPPKIVCLGECFDIGGQSFCETGAYSVVLQSVDGCDSTVNFSLFKIDPKAKITGPTSLCGDPAITVSGPPQANISKKWTDSAQNLLGTATNLTITLPGKYFLETKITQGPKTCTATDSIEIVPGIGHPNLSTALPDSLGCAQNPVALAAQSTSAAVVFNWSGPQNFMAAGPVANAFFAGNYVVTATLPDGCSSSDTLVVEYFDRKNTFSLAANPASLPAPPASATNFLISMTVKNEDSIAIDLAWEQVYSGISSTATAQVFDKNGLQAVGQLRDTFQLQPGESAPLQVLIKDGPDDIGCGWNFLLVKNLCTLRDTATAIFKVDCTVGTEGVLGGKNLRIFPNPTENDRFFVENQTNSTLFLNMRMPDGRLFFSKKIGPGTVEVAMPSFPAGAYFLFFENESGSFLRVEKLLRL